MWFSKTHQSSSEIGFHSMAKCHNTDISQAQRSSLQSSAGCAAHLDGCKRLKS